jgi:hypothetical protein
MKDLAEAPGLKRDVLGYLENMLEDSLTSDTISEHIKNDILPDMKYANEKLTNISNLTEAYLLNIITESKLYTAVKYRLASSEEDETISDKTN